MDQVIGNNRNRNQYQYQISHNHNVQTEELSQINSNN